MRRKRLYLASPYGFSRQQRDELLPAFVEELTKLGAEVWEPFARNNQEPASERGWAFRVGQQDLADVRRCDGIFAIVNGTPPDEGVMVELGVAIARSIPTFLFRDDIRRCTDSDSYPLNLMLFTGMPEGAWRDYYYTDIEDLTDTGKALLPWLADDETAIEGVT